MRKKETALEDRSDAASPGALTSFHGKPDVGADYLPYLAALFSGFGLRTAYGVLCSLFRDTSPAYYSRNRKYGTTADVRVFCKSLSIVHM